jgi:hypothetical protein
MVPSEIIAVFSEYSRKHENALCGIIQLLTLIAVRTCNCYLDLSGQIEQAQSHVCMPEIGETRNMYGLSVLKYVKMCPLRTTERQWKYCIKLYCRLIISICERRTEMDEIKWRLLCIAYFECSDFTDKRVSNQSLVIKV